MEVTQNNPEKLNRILTLSRDQHNSLGNKKKIGYPSVSSILRVLNIKCPQVCVQRLKPCQYLYLLFFC